ncbi:signal peptidase II [Jannaschia pohangensis]|uniref:Lipoprotein signal peptidase n=1 Tax=Jannaschia pohangensis TaxID=390807 RepID=A0A1I3NGM8_9RHOB|nr:signal peptidase II [Jannaschia pohangensis]SFJ08464.1 signal peptidase II . Aspartic peptidase. MEROPS family A08 [Jannaschia pohangensis]
MRALVLSALAAFGIDQASKVAVVHMLDLKTIGTIDVLPPFLVFRMGWNRGINFGLFAEAHDAGRWIMIALAVVIPALLIWWARGFSRPLARVAAGLVVGGALANGLDRVLYGAVADFLNMSCCGFQNPYAFNLADVFIFAGAIGLVFLADDTHGKDRAKTP